MTSKMLNHDILDFSATETEMQPYLHFSSTDVLQDGLEKELFDWFESTDAWGLTEMDFYTQFEFSLFDVTVPDKLKALLSENAVEAIVKQFVSICNTSNLTLVGVTAHKLVDGHKIGVHNDYIGDEETHRLVIQINPGWEESNGGYLMLFGSEDPEDVQQLIMPIDNSAFGFEISNQSYHAVSRVNNYSRYTLVYTFKA